MKNLSKIQNNINNVNFADINEIMNNVSNHVPEWTNRPIDQENILINSCEKKAWYKGINAQNLKKVGAAGYIQGVFFTGPKKF